MPGEGEINAAEPSGRPSAARMMKTDEIWLCFSGIKGHLRLLHKALKKYFISAPCGFARVGMSDHFEAGNRGLASPEVQTCLYDPVRGSNAPVEYKISIRLIMRFMFLSLGNLIVWRKHSAYTDG